MIKQFWFFPLIFAFSLFLFYPSLNYYFFQDDWFVLNWVRTGNLLSFFEFRTDIIYWRPISMPIFFWIGEKIFGLNPLGFHLLSFIIHLFNVFLISIISFLLFKNKKAALITGLLYATSSFHFMTLSWLSLTWNAIGFFFFQISIIFYILNRNRNSSSLYCGIIIFFLLSLVSTEFAITFPMLIITLEFILNAKSRKDYLSIIPVIAPIFIVIIAYLLSRTIFYPIPSKGEYELTLGLGVFKNLFWYGLWLFNLPEELKYQIILSKLHVTENFLNAARNYLQIIIFTAVINVILFFYILGKVLNAKTIRLFITSVIFFIAGLLPVLFLAEHSFPYYLTIPSVLLFVFMGLTLSQYSQKYKSEKSTLLIVIFTISWLVTSHTTLALTKKIHWVTAEENLSRKYINIAHEKYPTLPTNLTIEIPNSGKQIIQSLMDQNAMQVIYNNDKVKTVYK
ncbi:hypothetical protein A3G14_00080 [Candidatus Curtissbacteria bacterium RIFCSPLOWO2_12_FULL_38_9]|uniref:Glycosyltransferase RgtA/B/C/D-like domain-containing protein n=1 Tax=Candidatus Curtissbacteria bacterium RIFCSPLOWO2_12_FULL_38_9 TaxID=1797735 RepID=A0A1F5I7N8_9BACT|nr:MAG: hypothetical protein A2775_02810 [Candidatus Curtissbacteria bacterium RIFCSPHIGHO2_01_FULL_39_57]OGE12407.1 MAG: hypothetical protein A3G14_00080 [Candidatus Curtissbacteria bacterium RIFCSPLOWO2_12_FULL_38_9]